MSNGPKGGGAVGGGGDAGGGNGGGGGEGGDGGEGSGGGNGDGGGADRNRGGDEGGTSRYWAPLLADEASALEPPGLDAKREAMAIPNMNGKNTKAATGYVVNHNSTVTSNLALAFCS